MILMDEEGSKIQCNVEAAFIQRLGKLLEECANVYIEKPTIGLNVGSHRNVYALPMFVKCSLTEIPRLMKNQNKYGRINEKYGWCEHLSRGLYLEKQLLAMVVKSLSNHHSFLFVDQSKIQMSDQSSSATLVYHYFISKSTHDCFQQNLNLQPKVASIDDTTKL
ncbi:hypothetical protein LXL04_011602 [Taraxacum kok-saghyz]